MKRNNNDNAIVLKYLENYGEPGFFWETQDGMEGEIGWIIGERKLAFAYRIKKRQRITSVSDWKRETLSIRFQRLIEGGAIEFYRIR